MMWFVRLSVGRCALLFACVCVFGGHWCSRPFWRGKSSFPHWHRTRLLATDLIKGASSTHTTIILTINKQ